MPGTNPPAPGPRALLLDRRGDVVETSGAGDLGGRSVAASFRGVPWHRLLARRRPFQARARDADDHAVLLVGVPAVLGRELGAAWHLSVLPAGHIPTPLDDTDVLVIGHDQHGGFRYGMGVCEPVLGVPLAHLATTHASTWSALALQVLATRAGHTTTTVHLDTADGGTLPTVATCRQLATDAFETTIRHRPTDQPAILVARAMQSYGAAEPEAALRALATALDGPMTSGTCLVAPEGSQVTGTVPEELLRATAVAASQDGFHLVVGPVGPGEDTQPPRPSGTAIGLAPRDPTDPTAVYVLHAIALLVEPSINRVEMQRRDERGLRQEFRHLLSRSLREQREATYVAHDLLGPLERALERLEATDQGPPEVVAQLRDSLEAARRLLEPRQVGTRRSDGEITGESYDLDLALSSTAANFPGTRLRLEAGQVRVVGSEVLGRAAIRALIDNAHRHGHQGSIEVRSSMTAHRAIACITNAATSPVTPASLLPRQGGPTTRHGLGLAAVADLCHREGIEMSVASTGEVPVMIEVELGFPLDGSHDSGSAA